jgi:hypothetical protein
MNLFPSSLLTCVLIGSALTPSVHAQAEPAQTNLSLLALPPRVQHPPLFLLQKRRQLFLSKSSQIALPALSKPLWRSAGASPLRPNLPQKARKLQLAASCPAIPVCCRPIGRTGEKTWHRNVSIRAFSVNITPASFKERQFLVVNLTPKEIAGEIGGKRVAFPPGKPVFVTPKANVAEDLCHAMFLTREAEKPWKPFFSTNWPLKDKIRGLVFFYQDPSGRKILMHTVSDFL